jgi:hypothetical protein
MSLDPSLALSLLPHSAELSRFHAAQLCPDNSICQNCKTILLVGVTAHTRFQALPSTIQEPTECRKRKRKIEKKKERQRGPKIICNTCGWTKQMIGKRKKPIIKEDIQVEKKLKMKASGAHNMVPQKMPPIRPIQKAETIEKVSMIDMISKKKPEKFKFTRSR